MAENLGGDYYAEWESDGRLHLFSRCDDGFDMAFWLDKEVAENLGRFIEAVENVKV